MKLFWMTVVVILFASLTTFTHAEWPQSGVYLEKQVNRIYEGEKRGWRKTQTTDCLAIKQHQAKKRLDIEVNLIQTNAHLCTFSGSMIQVRPDYWEVAAPENAEASDEKCRLGLEVKSDKLVLHDPEWKCKDDYCGARASFDEAAFYTASRLVRNKNVSSCFQD